jgi:hypothetical protein
LMPGYLALPTVMGNARRCKRGKSTCVFRHCAWNVAKRFVYEDNESHRISAIRGYPVKQLPHVINNADHR